MNEIERKKKEQSLKHQMTIDFFRNDLYPCEMD